MRWRLTYMPANEPASGTTREFEGTEEGLTDFFIRECACGFCRKAVEDGFDVLVDKDGEECGRLEVTSIWSTGCACEWDCEEIA